MERLQPLGEVILRRSRQRQNVLDTIAEIAETGDSLVYGYLLTQRASLVRKQEEGITSEEENNSLTTLEEVFDLVFADEKQITYTAWNIRAPKRLESALASEEL